MTLFALLNIVLELRATLAWKDGGNFIWVDDYDFPGEDLNKDNPLQTNKKDCGPLCFKNPECVRFSWDTLRNCYHKRWSAVDWTAKKGARTGYIPGRPWTTSGNIVWGDNCDFNGQDTNADKPLKTNREDCGTSCLNTRLNCTHFSWDTLRNCYHKIWTGSDAKWKDGARCGYITSPPPTPAPTTAPTPAPTPALTTAPAWAPSWTVSGNVVWGSNCDFPSPSYDSPSQEIDYSITTCSEICLNLIWNSGPCTHFTVVSDRFCYLRNKRSFHPAEGGSKNPVYSANTKCGYIKDRVAR